MEDSQEGEVAVDSQEEAMTQNICDWCSRVLPGVYSEFDGSKWHPVCLAQYMRYRGKRVVDVPPDEFLCPTGDHTHKRNPYGVGGDNAP